MTDLFAAYQSIADRATQRAAEERARETKLRQEQMALEIDLLLADMASLLRLATVPRGREDQKAGVLKRAREYIGRAA